MAGNVLLQEMKLHRRHRQDATFKLGFTYYNSESPIDKHYLFLRPSFSQNQPTCRI